MSFRPLAPQFPFSRPGGPTGRRPPRPPLQGRVTSIAFAAALFTLLPFATAHAQQPHLASFFPGGASAGKTVDIQIKGGNLIGVRGFLIGGGPGVTGEIVGGSNPIDETARPVFQSKCTTCHEARSPENRSMSPEQWADTVKRMITQHSADIPVADRDRIIGYLQGMAKAGQLSARITVAANAAPGMHEIRLLTDHGASSAIAFEVGGSIPDMNAPAFKTGKPDEAAVVKLPIAINGILAQSGERDWYRFTAKKGQHLTFNLKAERLNAQSASFFFPTLHLYDASGKELAKSLGKYGVDPYIDWIAPTDGDYLVCAHDLLWHGNPASVYRLTMGELPSEGVLSPGWARPGATVSAKLVPSTVEDATGDNTALASPAFSLQIPSGIDGMTTVSTPMGDAPILVRDLPDGGGPTGQTATPVAIPALFRGGIAQPGQKDTFAVHAAKGGLVLELYAQRLGSPLHAQVIVRNGAGDVIVQKQSEGDGDLSLGNAFPRPGDYTVEVSDADGAGGNGYLYCWEATERQSADVTLSASPDVVNLTPGHSMTMIVRAPRRNNLAGPIAFSVHGLPTGVTATDAVLFNDMNEAVIVLTAAPDAPGGTGALVTVDAHLLPPGTQRKAPPAPAATLPPAVAASRKVSPVEMFGVNNNLLYLPRATFAVAVQAVGPPFTLTAAEGRTELVLADGKDVKIPVTIERKDGFKGPLFVSVQGLPGGISASQNTYNIPANETQTTITLHVNHDAGFFTSKPAPGTPPLRITVSGFVANINNDFLPTITSPPITLTPQ